MQRDAAPTESSSISVVRCRRRLGRAAVGRLRCATRTEPDGKAGADRRTEGHGRGDPVANRKTLTFGLPTPAGFAAANPHARTDDAGRMVASFYSDTLVDWRGGKFVPSLATAWKAVDDTTSKELTLHDGVKFSSGASLDSAAVVYNVQRILTGISPDAESGAIADFNESLRQRLRDLLAPLADRLRIARRRQRRRRDSPDHYQVPGPDLDRTAPRICGSYRPTSTGSA